MTDMLHNQSVSAFLDVLASKAPAPGGGSVAALSGAMAAGLISMVCAITIDKQKDAEERAVIQSLWDQAEQLRDELQRLAQADVEIFQRLATAYKLPRTTDADAASRSAAIQKLTRQATDVPFNTARAATRLLPLCTALAPRCSRMLVSDIGIAATLSRSTAQSALLNVEINLAGLEDQNYVRLVRSRMGDLTVGLPEETQGVLEIVLARINQ